MSKMFPKTTIASAVLLANAAFTLQAAAAPSVVTNGLDSGEGSLREALSTTSGEVVIATKEDIEIVEPLQYDGEGDLIILGNGQTVRTSYNVNLLEITQGANLTINNLDFEGPGGFDIENRGDEGEVAGKGIFVDVADDQTGTVKLVLNDVSVSGVANHGIHISDCNLADDCGGGSGGGGEGSAAGIEITFNNVHVADVGYGRFDADGLRADERDGGSVRFMAYDSSFLRVGADGIELDEGQDGGVFITVSDTDMSRNGGYCDPGVLEPFLEGEFALEDEVTEEELESSFEFGSPDDRCLEVDEVELFEGDEFVQSYVLAIDLDDGIDLDEAGDGAISALIFDSKIERNLDEGVDLDEEGQGALSAYYVNTKANRNTDDGFKLTEEDEGAVNGFVFGVVARNNGGKGLVFEEADQGGLDVIVQNTKTARNDDNDDTGIEAVEEDSGSGTLTVENSTIKDGFDLDGVVLNDES
ncbi:MAG: hypothetical protein AAF699_04900 [Pseudomonadota bacterium]